MISVAIIGAGVGADHLAAYQQLPERFRVEQICDLDVDRAAALAERGRGIGVTTEIADVVGSGVDLVDICLPPHLHLSACRQALEAGKHVICEKPVVTSLAEADELEELVAASGRMLSPIFQYRYGLGTAQFRAVVAAGLAGRPLVATVETHWNRGRRYYDAEWRGTWAGERGGALLGHAIHIHDLLVHLLGPVERVSAELDTMVNDIEVEDCAALSLRLANGCLVTSSVTLGSAEETSRLRIVFDRLTVESDHAPYAPATGSWRFVARRPGDQAAVDAVVAAVVPPAIGYVGQFAAVADAIEHGGTDAVSLADGRRSLELVAAAYHSARTGRPETLPLDRSHPLHESWMP